jgi:hypothetical protein
MPLQHIPGEMLQLLRRETSRAHIENLIHRIRAGIPGIGLRTSFIVGFGIFFILRRATEWRKPAQTSKHHGPPNGRCVDHRTAAPGTRWTVPMITRLTSLPVASCTRQVSSMIVAGARAGMVRWSLRGSARTSARFTSSAGSLTRGPLSLCSFFYHGTSHGKRSPRNVLSEECFSLLKIDRLRA